MLSRNAALPPINDQMSGIASSHRERLRLGEEKEPEGRDRHRTGRDAKDRHFGVCVPHPDAEKRIEDGRIGDEGNPCARGEPGTLAETQLGPEDADTGQQSSLRDEQGAKNQSALLISAK